MQEPIDLYVNAIDLAKENPTLSNQEKALLNRFKILLRSEAVEEANSEMALMGKVKRETLHHIRELAEGIFENRIRNCNVDDNERERILNEGKKRADVAEEMLLNNLLIQGMIYNS